MWSYASRGSRFLGDVSEISPGTLDLAAIFKTNNLPPSIEGLLRRVESRRGTLWPHEFPLHALARESRLFLF